MADSSPFNAFDDELKELTAIALRPVMLEAQLQANLRAIVMAFYDADLSRFDVATVRAGAAHEMQALFQLRLYLRSQIPNWAKRGFMTPQVYKALRQAFLVTRYASDMLGEIASGHPRLAPGEPTRRAFTGADINVLVNPAYYTGEDLAFEPGDVLLVRGQAHNSAAIARIGDVESAFSHVGIVHRADDGHLVLVESLIEAGAIVTPLDKALEHGIGRAILFRYRDRELARRAAQWIHDHVQPKVGFRRIWYDFSMRMEGYRRLYCSKLVRLAFLKASKGEVQIPAYPTRLVMKNRDFLRRVGVKADVTFAPGDLEADPRFDIVAEWQDYRVTAGLRNQDMILSKLFEVMERDGYVFKEDLPIWLISYLGSWGARLSEETKDMLTALIPKIPRNMRRKTIAVVAMLHQTAEPLLQDVTRIERQRIASSGYAPHPRDVLEHLEHAVTSSAGQIGYLVRRA